MLIGAGFAVAVAFYANSLVDHATHSGFMVLAAVFGAYMAMNIGANDVANNVGPAVGAGAITIGGAIIIASIFLMSSSFTSISPFGKAALPSLSRDRSLSFTNV